MNIPTRRELELETLLRQRDAQVAELTVRIATRSRYDGLLTPPRRVLG